MELVKGRGLECNGVCFNYVDGKVVMAMYRELPGVSADVLQPNVSVTFSVDQWGEINKYLRETLDDVEGVFSDDDDDGDEGEEEVEEEESVLNVVSAPSGILPKVNSVPKMTEDDKEEIEEKDGEEDEQEGS